MTKADIEVMLQNLAATTRSVDDTQRLVRLSAEHIRAAHAQIVMVTDHIQEVNERTRQAITAGLRALHEDES